MGIGKSIFRQICFLRDYLNAKLFFNAKSYAHVIRAFHQLYFNSKVADNNTFFFGTQILKNPFDLWIFQEIIYDVKPDLIIETGTHKGGSALYYSFLLDKLGKGRIISIDIQDWGPLPKLKRVTYLRGSAVSQEITEKIAKMIKPGEKVMVILDDDHTMKHVLTELRTYGKFVTKGSYMICEDTMLGGNPVKPEYGDPGPLPAVKKFLQENNSFNIDKKREKFYFSFNYSGYLKRVK
jgi:cephalosporin hydroxylase